MLSETATRIVTGLEALGFEATLPPAAAPLAAACTAVRWARVDAAGAPATVEVVCIVDGVSEPGRTFGMVGAQLAAIASDCAELAGRRLLVVANKVRITIVEIGTAETTPEDRARLDELLWGPSGATLVEALHVTPDGAVWAKVSDVEATPLTPRLAVLARGDVPPVPNEAAAHRPARALAATMKAHAFVGALRSGPFATYTLIAVLALAFVVEAAAAGSLDPDASMLLALGGMSAVAVRVDGELYRLASATLLHGDLTHLLLNGVALLFGGAIVEMLVGRRWMLVAYFVCGVAGSVASMTLNPPNLVSIGASGAIMGLLATGFVLAFRIPDRQERWRLVGHLARYLVPSLVPLAMSAQGGGRVDYAAHMGGAAAGFVVGGLVLLLGRLTSEQKPFPRIAGALAAVGILLYALGAIGAVRRFGALGPEARLKAEDVLVKDEAIPQDPALRVSTVDTWGQGKERDPRVHLFRAFARLDADDLSGAERETRAGLAEPLILDKFFADRGLETRLRSLLCAILVDEGRRDDAVKEARPVCHAGDGGTVPESLSKLDLCDAP
jgi:rhomboid protease GluP